MQSFASALEDSSLKYSKRHLLLGNGFSIACRPNIFQYKKLFEQANFKNISPEIVQVFNYLDTQDFERVIKTLKDTASVITAYDPKNTLADQLNKDAETLKEILVQTIANSHPAWPGDITDDEYACCREFLNNFDIKYTLNYDLLLYWVQMHTEEGEEPTSDDGFRRADDDSANYVTWNPANSHKQDTYYLHGALHLFDAMKEIKKFTWINTNIRLIDQIRQALSNNLFPIFVAEGTSAEKLSHVRHLDYLSKGYRSFIEIGGCLFIFGHSLADNDDHYIQKLSTGKLDEIYVGIYGDPNTPHNQWIINKANGLSKHRGRKQPLLVSFYDAATAYVWRH